MQDTTDLLAPDAYVADSSGGAADSPRHSTSEHYDGAAPPATTASEETAGRPRRARTAGGSLTAKTLAELQGLAAAAGVAGTAKMRKGDLILALQASDGGADKASTASVATSRTRARNTSAGVSEDAPTLDLGTTEAAPDAPAPSTETPAERTERPESVESTSAPVTDGETPSGERPPRDRNSRRERNERNGQGDRTDRPERNGQNGERPERNGQGDRNRQQGDRPERTDRPERNGQQGERNGQGDRQNRPQNDRPERTNDRPERANDRPERANDRPQGQNTQGGNNAQGQLDEDDDGTGRGRRGRYRDRNNRNRRNRDGLPIGEAEPTFNEDDVLVPVAGIVDILDNYAFVRTSGYLAGPNDVYVSLSQVRRYGIRRGDAVTGAVKQPREGDAKRDKFNALVRLDTVNGIDPELSPKRPEFNKLTPLYPQDRLRLETESHILTTRVIDLVMPVGKGQRALIVSPPKAGKTTIMQDIANAITTNNPECHLMVVLVDERPEEVTDMQRSVKGEVIASTFDRPPTDHITVAELSIERAKRLVEMGHDVVVLLDNITRLGRAYNLGAPASGRILTGGVDAAALYQPKKFLGAARNIENGGSLTILATALVETGSAMDGVFFEEYKGTGNAELKLDRGLANKRLFPAIDIDSSGTRKEELLLARDELQIVIRLRRVLHAVEGGGLELLLEKLRETKTNTEFLLQVQKTMPGAE